MKLSPRGGRRHRACPWRAQPHDGNRRLPFPAGEPRSAFFAGEGLSAPCTDSAASSHGTAFEHRAWNCVALLPACCFLPEATACLESPGDPTSCRHLPPLGIDGRLVSPYKAPPVEPNAGPEFLGTRTLSRFLSRMNLVHQLWKTLMPFRENPYVLASRSILPAARSIADREAGRDKLEFSGHIGADAPIQTMHCGQLADDCWASPKCHPVARPNSIWHQSASCHS